VVLPPLSFSAGFVSRFPSLPLSFSNSLPPCRVLSLSSPSLALPFFSRSLLLLSLSSPCLAHGHIQTKVSSKLSPETTEQLEYLDSNSKRAATVRDADESHSTQHPTGADRAFIADAAARTLRVPKPVACPCVSSVASPSHREPARSRPPLLLCRHRRPTAAVTLPPLPPPPDAVSRSSVVPPRTLRPSCLEPAAMQQRTAPTRKRRPRLRRRRPQHAAPRHPGSSHGRRLRKCGPLCCVYLRTPVEQSSRDRNAPGQVREACVIKDNAP
jgi:hypothetical protein